MSKSVDRETLFFERFKPSRLMKRFRKPKSPQKITFKLMVEREYHQDLWCWFHFENTLLPSRVISLRLIKKKN